MIATVTADGKKEYEFINTLKARSQNSDKNVIPTVSEIIENVRINGDKVVKDYTIKFDGKAPEKTEILKEDIDNIIAKCDSEYIETVQKATANISDFHRRQLQQSWLTTKSNGVIMGQRIRGLKRVGLYVPGGTAAYPSSVLMNAIPAKIAGVEELIMCTPPQKDGTPNPNIIAAAKIAGVDRIFLMGGAQAVAALAYGTETVPKVDKIVGHSIPAVNAFQKSVGTGKTVPAGADVALERIYLYELTVPQRLISESRHRLTAEKRICINHRVIPQRCIVVALEHIRLAKILAVAVAVS